MTGLVRGLTLAELVVFTILAVVAGMRWGQRGGAVRGWVFATVGVLAAVIIAGELLPDEPSGWALWALKLLVAALALFPYALYRFAATFEPPPPAFRVVGTGLTIAACAGIFAFRDLPATGEPRSAAFQAYALVILAQWLVLIGYVSHRLWRGGRGRSTVARRRMRTLAVGAGALALALLVSVAAPPAGEPGVLQVIAGALPLLAAPLFLTGFAPPAFVLASWRRPDQRALRVAEAELMGASSEADVGNALLPHVARVLAARAAVLADDDKRVIASFGLDEAGAARLATAARSPEAAAISPGLLSIPLGRGLLAVEADVYTPYFGRDETEVLRDLASLTDVALRRARVSEQERRVAVDLAQANDAMREFVAVASHDLRTPISLVRGYASLLTSSWDALADEDKQQYVEAIARQGAHLSRLVDDLLTVSRLDANAIRPDLRKVSLADALKEILGDLGRAADARIDIDENLVVEVDTDHLARIVRNLVENALAYGDPPVELTAVTVGDSVDVHIRDHGEGVAPDFVPRLFERFARADTTRTKELRGTGLGLSIVRGLARANGGDVTYRDADGGGACFILHLRRKG